MWLLPSLGRPEKAFQVAQQNPHVKITLRLHKGDRKLKTYLRKDWPKKWKVIVGPRLTLAETMNWAFQKFPRERQYGFLADDTLPSPKDWHQRLASAAGSRYIAYPDDGIHGEKLCTHHCIGGDLMREVGFWALPGLKHNCFDTTWFIIGQKRGLLKYLPEVKFNHHHPINGAQEDDTYHYGQSFFKHDLEVFKNWTNTPPPPGPPPRQG
jgi:hypothetical protein